MTTLLLAAAALMLPVFPIASLGLLVVLYVYERIGQPITQMGDLILFYAAMCGIGAAYAGW
jgi:hypothetical protein